MGMTIPEPSEIRIEHATEKFTLKTIFNELAQNGYEYVLITHPDHADAIHRNLIFFLSNLIINPSKDEMKFFEKHTEVVSQGVLYTTVRNVVHKNQRLTLANIVHKTNVKLGGLNYAPNSARIPLQE